MTDSPQAVRVEQEWGNLQEAIVGHSADVVVAQWHEPYHATFGPEVNEWYRVHGGQRLDSFDPELANRMIEQQDRLAQLLIELGVVVHRVDPLTDSADRTYLTDRAEGMFSFPRDPVLVVGSEVIETSLKHLWRRRERFAVRPILEAAMERDPGATWVAVPPARTDPGARSGPFLEGGDVLLLDDEVLVGRSGYATDPRGINWLQRHLRGRRRVTEVRLTEDAFHLDCALSLPRPGLAVVYRDAFVDGLPAAIADWEIIEVDREEQQAMATNLLVINAAQVICDARHRRLSDELRRRDFDVIEIPFDGPAVFGGGLRCSHHPLRRAGGASG